MEFKIKHNSLQSIYKQLGLEEKGRVQQFAGKTVANNLKKYVSRKSGAQETSVQPIDGGRKVIINVPYARFQAEGKLMVGAKSRRAWARKGEEKVVINKNLKYHSDRLRGAHPFERMKADKEASITKQIANYAKRVAK